MSVTGLSRSLVTGWMKVASRNRRVLAGDLFLLAAAVYLGYALRLTLLIQQGFRDDLLRAALAFVPVTLLALWVCGVYRVYWPQASVEEYLRLGRGYALGALGFLLIDRLWTDLTVPRTSLAILLLLGLFFLVAFRASWRVVRPPLEGTAEPRPTLIVGAGDAGSRLARDLLRRGDDLVPLGFVDDDPDKRGKIIASLPVLGDAAELGEIVRQRGVRVVLIALPSASGQRIRAFLERLSPLGVEVRVLPALHELASGAVSVSRLRSVSLEDLLRREPIRLDLEGIDRVLRGRTVLVTGAGGSIGSEICRQVLAHGPRSLLVLGHGEQSLYNLLERFSEEGVTIPCRPLVADVGDEATLRRIFETHRPQVVFHAGAHKHVPLMEENPREALRVNALGTWNVASLAGEIGAERMVMVSTDKAVHPSSVMGATKRLAERMLEEAQSAFPGTAFLAVRFGNVLGSRGSVVPKFEAQIARGGPVTVTHPEMRRYFMLIPEAVSLVLQAASMGRGGELFVLDMGEPVVIAQMAETLIRLHGLEPHRDIPIVYSGIRPGEKLFEELFYDPDHVDRTSHDKIFRARLDRRDGGMAEKIRALAALPEDRLRQELFALCEDVPPSGVGDR